MQNNPYIAGNPVGKTDAFIGRVDVLREVLKIIENSNQNALALFGQRRIGKTSILQYLTSQLSINRKYRSVYFDLQDKGALSLGHVIESLARTIAFTLDGSEPELGDRPEIVFRDSWLPALLNTLEHDEKLVLLFDEFDVLADPTGDQAAKAFFPYLRSLLEQDLDKLKFVFVLGRRIDDLDSIALSVFKGIPPYRVSLIDQRDTEELIRLSERNSTLSWTDDAVRYVWQLTHGHPYLTQQLCSQVWESLYSNQPETTPIVREEDVEGVLQKTLDSSGHALEWIWNGLPPAERVVISALAEAGPGPIDQEQLEKILHDSGVRVVIRELRDAPALLQEWDLIEPAENKKNSYVFRVDLLRRWLILTKPLRRVQEELDRLTPVADNLYKAGQGLYELGDLDGASGLLSQAVAQNPNHLRANELLGEIFVTQNQWEEALKIYEHLHKFHPAAARSRLVQVLLALANKSENDSEKVEYYTRVLELEPQKQAGLQSIRDKLRSEMLARELQVLDRLQREKHYKDARVKAEELALAYPGDYDWNTLIASLDRHLDLHGIYQLAMNAYKSGDTITARRLFADVVAIEPEFEEAVHYLNITVSGVDTNIKSRWVDQGWKNLTLLVITIISLFGLVSVYFLYSRAKAQVTSLSTLAAPVGWTSTPSPTATIYPTSTAITATREPILGDTLRILGQGTINALAISPDGNLLGIATDLGTHLYNFDTLQHQAFFPEDIPVDAITFSPDSENFAVGTRKYVVHIYNINTGQITQNLVGHYNWITCLAYSQDGSQLAAGSYDNVIRIWDTQNGALIRVLRGHTDYIYSLAYSPNGLQLATGSYDSTVKIWNVADGNLQHTLKGHTDGIVSLVYSADGLMLATGSYDDTVKIWDPITGKLMRTLTGHTDSVESVAFTPDGKKLASGSSDNSIRIWDLSDGHLDSTLTGNTDSVLGLAYSSDGKRLVSRSSDGAVKIWNAVDGNLINKLELFLDGIRSIAYSPDGKNLAAGGYDAKVRIWNPENGELLRTLEGHENTIYSLAYSPDGSRLATGEWQSIWIWNMEDYSRIMTLDGHTGWVYDIDYSPDGELLATVSSDDTAKIWASTDGRVIFTLEGFTNDVRTVAFSPDSTQLVAGSNDQTIRIWNVSDGSLVRTIDNVGANVYSVTFAPDGSQVVAGLSNSSVRIYNVSDGSLLRTLSGPDGPIYSLAYSPDGLRIAAGSTDDTVWIWNVADGEMLYVLSGHTDTPYSLVFSPHGQTLATGSEDGTIRIWKLK